MAGKLFDPELIKAIGEGISSRGWIHVEGVLSTGELLAINNFFESRVNEFELASVLEDGKLVKNERVRGDRFLSVNYQNPPDELKGIIQFLGSLTEELNTNLHLGIVDQQCRPAMFPPTFYFKKHIDSYGEASHVITYVFYVHESWSKNDGGSLILYDHNDQQLVRILPVPGSFIAFKSRDFPHEVKVCLKERRSITGWLHNRLLD